MIAAYVNKWTILVAVVAAVGVGGYLKGRADGRAVGAEHAIKEIVDANKEWNNALSEAERLDAFDRCIAVGGLPDDCAILLRNQSPTPGK